MSEDEADYCCEEHYPSTTDTIAEQLAHRCPVCGWSAGDEDGES